jgi:Ni/Fe-hydrogenase subunit HybB-like protein
MKTNRGLTSAGRWPEITFWRFVFLVVTATGAVAAFLRITRGLGASTNLSDQFPWGLWIGFDMLCGVGLAAGGFAITASVYLFNLKRFHPIIRPTVLTAFLGYIFAILGLLFDLGQPQRIWHAMIMWNPRSVMFEVAWCVMLYSTVLALEFSPVVFERLNLDWPRRIVRAITVPLVILGVILSTLHQSSLGSLYLIVPEKLHPFWYSPLLPVLFFTSAIAAGLAMVIVESYLCQRAFNHQLEMSLLEPVARTMVVVLSVYGILRLQDLARRGVLTGLRHPGYEGAMLFLELGLGVLLPIILLSIPRIRSRQTGMVAGAFLAVLGFVMHRLNVSVTGMERASGVAYFPSWMEIAISLALVAAGFALFGLAVRYLPIFSEAEHSVQAAQVPSWLVVSAPEPMPEPRFTGGGLQPLPHPLEEAGDD